MGRGFSSRECDRVGWSLLEALQGCRGPRIGLDTRPGRLGGLSLVEAACGGTASDRGVAALIEEAFAKLAASV